MERTRVSEEAQARDESAYKILFRERPDDSQLAGEDRKELPAVAGSPVFDPIVRNSERGISK